MSKHGIAIRERKTKKLVKFMECRCGREALLVLSGVRRNMNTRDYKAEEEGVEDSEISAIAP